MLQFCNAVLEKSRSIGVRGEITQEYLVRLGIKRRKIDVIGCPSMYTFGDFLPLKKATESIIGNKDFFFV